MSRSESNSSGKTDCRATRDAFAIWQAGVAAVHGRKLVGKLVSVSDEAIEFGEMPVPLFQANRICLVAVGKAATAMTAGFLERIAGTEYALSGRVFGQVNIPCNPSQDAQCRELLQKFAITVNEVRPANVNLPTPAAVAATQSIRSMVNSLRPNDLCLVLLSGGGSALLTAPRAPVTLAEKLAVIEFLFANHADIVDVNRIRAVLSDVKQGGLVRRCPSRTIVTLVISDIIGDPIHLIAGGPTSLKSDDHGEALEVARRFDPCENKLPSSVWQLLNAEKKQEVGLEADNTSSLASQHKHFLLANNESAVAAAARCAAELGYQVISNTVAVSQSAEDAGRELIDRLQANTGKCCFISGGEPTVSLATSEVRGVGGRNQQLVLAALQHAQNSKLAGQQNWCLLSAGTDGQDGVSDAAGAWLDAEVLERVRLLELDVNRSLEFNNAAEFFRLAKGLFRCQATDTNVCDLRIVIRDSA